MTVVNEKLKEKIRESLSSVLPITVIVLLLSVTLVPMEIGTLALFLTGAALLIVGMGFFSLGADIAMMPMEICRVMMPCFPYQMLFCGFCRYYTSIK